MAYSRDDILNQMETDCAAYHVMARRQEWAFWIGSGAAAICSAVAGLAIAADLDKAGLGRAITALLAVVPAVWAALDRTLRFSQLSAFNYEIHTELRVLILDAQGKSLDPETKALVRRYGRMLKRENQLFRQILLSEESENAEADSQAAATTPKDHHASRGQTNEEKS